MAYFIIIRGPLGVGKTTIAKILAKELKATYISIDGIIAKYGLDRIDPDIACIPAINFIAGQEKVVAKASKDLRSGKNVIFDGNFYHKEQIKHLVRVLSEVTEHHYIFTLKAPVEVCIERDKGRKKTYGEWATRAVYKFVTRFNAGNVIGTGGKSAEKVVDMIISLIKP
jgi:predicted kinase